MSDPVPVVQRLPLRYLARFSPPEARYHSGGCLCSHLGSGLATPEFVVGVLPDLTHVPGGLYIDGLLANA